MPSFTKKAIIDSFFHVAAKKSYEKITVRDIVDDCGINRNTFYYYFQDIHAVVEELCEMAFAQVPEDQSLAVTLTTLFDWITDFVDRQPKAWRNFAFSVGFEGLERFFSKGLDSIIYSCLCRENCPTSLRDDMARFLRHAFIGLVLENTRGEGKKMQLQRILGILESGFEHAEDLCKN